MGLWSGLRLSVDNTEPCIRVQQHIRTIYCCHQHIFVQIDTTQSRTSWNRTWLNWVFLFAKWPQSMPVRRDNRKFICIRFWLCFSLFRCSLFYSECEECFWNSTMHFDFGYERPSVCDVEYCCKVHFRWKSLDIFKRSSLGLFWIHKWENSILYIWNFWNNGCIFWLSMLHTLAYIL